MGVGGSKLGGGRRLVENNIPLPLKIRARDGRPLAPRGYVPVYVGLQGGESKRFMIQTASLGDADVCELLCRSAEEYGFCNRGVLKIPCDAKSFEEQMMMTKGGTRRRRVMTA